jgi:UDP-N-acetylmuramate dehydrogenase
LSRTSCSCCSSEALAGPDEGQLHARMARRRSGHSARNGLEGAPGKCDSAMIYQQYFPLSGVLYYGIGGTARHMLTVSAADDVLRALEFIRGNRIEKTIVAGLGSNLLFPDGLFDGAVLRIVGTGSPQVSGAEDGLVTSFAGEELDVVIAYGFEHGFTGLEWAGGLPGTVGAGVRGNVGAFGGELKDVLVWAEVVDLAEPEPEIQRLDKEELDFSYRSSLVKRSRSVAVLSASFLLQRAGRAEVEQAAGIYRSNIEYRQRNHPMDYPTCGSVFKNIARRQEVERVLAVWPDVEEMVRGRWHGKVSMGYIINRLGLAGRRLGGAQISEKHNNFIVNLGGARFSDVNGLIQMVREAVVQTFGFDPEPEVEIAGEDR